MQYNTEDLLSSIKLRSLVPISQATFQDADLIMLANEELQLKLVSDIMSERENFFETNSLTPIVAGVDTYTMPNRAIGNALKVVWTVDSVGNKRKLQLKEVDQIAAYSGSGDPAGFFIQGDQIVLLPKPVATGGFVRFDYYARPNKLVPTASAAKIASASTAAGLTTFTVDTDLTATLSIGSLVDVISMNSPYVLWGAAVPVVTVTSTTIQVTSSLVSDQAGNIQPVAGDYICLKGQANIPQVPQEFHPVLAQMVANRLLFGLGDMNKYQLGMETLKEDRANALKLIKNRVEATPLRIANRNGMLAAFSRRF